jgi:AcrR family transcriptional regulator
MTGRSTKFTPKGQRTRQRIVEAASRIIGVRGIARMTLEDVRAEARVSSSQIYHYFANRESLLLAVVDVDGQEASNDPMSGDFTSVDAMRAWCCELVDRYRRTLHHNVCPIRAPGSAVLDDKLYVYAVERLGQFERDVRDGYRAMLQSGELDLNVDADNLATVTVATLLGGVILSQFQQDAAPLERAVDAVLERLECCP